MPRHGEGIYKRKDGRWEARYIHHYEDGKAKYRFLYANSYAAVREKRKAELAMLPSKTTNTLRPGLSFREVSELWLAEKQDHVKASTYARYLRNIRVYLYPILETQPMNNLKPEQLKQLPRQLLASGGKAGAPLSAKTVCDILCVLKSVLTYAGANGYSHADPALISFPKKPRKPTVVLSEDDRIKIEKELWDSRSTVSLGILFAMYTGVRIGELCGLRWGDVDFMTGIVRIRRTVERITDPSPEATTRTKVVMNEPKTACSNRDIPLPRQLLVHIERFRGADDTYLVTGTKTHTEPRQFYSRYQTFLRRLGVPAYTFHTLRHTFATRCVEYGFDTKSLSEILGHSSVSTTLSLYVHPTLEQKRKQMERLIPTIQS